MQWHQNKFSKRIYTDETTVSKIKTRYQIRLIYKLLCYKESNESEIIVIETITCKNPSRGGKWKEIDMIWSFRYIPEGLQVGAEGRNTVWNRVATYLQMQWKL